MLSFDWMKTAGSDRTGRLATIFHHLQRQLFPALTAERGPLAALDQPFCQVLALTVLGRCTRRYAWCGHGPPPTPRVGLAHAFIARHAEQFPTTGALRDALRSRPRLRQICGWDSAGKIPSESTFSRAFAAFATDPLPQQIHEQMVKTHAGPKLAGHVSRDATAIEAPERPAPQPAPAAPAAPAAPRQRGRPRRGEVRPPTPPKRLELQPGRPRAENLADLPARGDVGCKRHSQGHQESWIGDKLHLDTVDGDFPVSAVLTRARVPDSQVACPWRR